MKSLDDVLQNKKNDPKKFSENYINYLIGLLNKINYSKIAECIDKIEEARINDKTIFIMGNGGSASTASHVSNDFGLAVLKKSKNPNLKPYRALSITDNMSVISATANDSDYSNVFLDQLKVHYRNGDIVVLISASGNSQNLVEAAKWVRSNNGFVISWLGFDGGILKSNSDLNIIVDTPKDEYAPVEDVHLIINHVIVTWMHYHIDSL